MEFEKKFSGHSAHTHTFKQTMNSSPFRVHTLLGDLCPDLRNEVVFSTGDLVLQ